MLTDADWAGLCAITETNRPEEQEYVLWVIRNRVESGRFGKGYEGVVLAPKQFSAFNGFTAHGTGRPYIFNSVASLRLPEDLLAAVHLAEKVLDELPEGNLFYDLPARRLGGTRDDRMTDNLNAEAALKRAQTVCHYWSPVSMKPAGSRPPWASSAKRLFTPPGIDPERFVFAEGVP